MISVRFQAIMKFQAHRPLEPPIEYNQDQTHLMNQSSFFSIILGVTEIYEFDISSRKKIGTEIPEKLRLQFLKK